MKTSQHLIACAANALKGWRPRVRVWWCVGLVVLGCRVRLLDRGESAEPARSGDEDSSGLGWTHDTTPFAHRPAGYTGDVSLLLSDAGAPNSPEGPSHADPQLVAEPSPNVEPTPNAEAFGAGSLPGVVAAMPPKVSARKPTESDAGAQATVGAVRSSPKRRTQTTNEQTVATSTPSSASAHTALPASGPTGSASSDRPKSTATPAPANTGGNP